jgi:hypothetical protein
MINFTHLNHNQPIMKKVLFAALAMTTMFSCKKENKKTEFEGSKVNFHQGQTWTTYRTDKDGNPQQLTLSLDNRVMNSVLTAGSGTHSHDNTVSVPLPQEALSKLPFKFVMLDWALNGHDPAGVYDKAHFDMHFYMVTPQEVDGYTDMPTMTQPVPAGYMPANYVAGPPVPKMGTHWIDITSPEFTGGGFTQTFLYGSYDGKVVFYEPMITHEFLRNTNKAEKTIPQPEKFANAGFYPTKMTIGKKGTNVEISLEGFQYRQAN